MPFYGGDNIDVHVALRDIGYCVVNAVIDVAGPERVEQETDRLVQTTLIGRAESTSEALSPLSESLDQDSSHSM